MNKYLEEKIKQEGDFEQGKMFGLPFVMWRHPNFGNWCGYVGVPKKSKLTGRNYYTYTESENGLSKIEQAIASISVHGGLTFAGKLSNKGVKDDLWYFGFDCAHAGDSEPYMIDKYPEMAYLDGYYKDKEFVRTECENLAKQLKDIIKDKLTK